jgi:hypothetical protein
MASLVKMCSREGAEVISRNASKFDGFAPIASKTIVRGLILSNKDSILLYNSLNNITNDKLKFISYKNLIDASELITKSDTITDIKSTIDVNKYFEYILYNECLNSNEKNGNPLKGIKHDMASNDTILNKGSKIFLKLLKAYAYVNFSDKYHNFLDSTILKIYIESNYKNKIEITNIDLNKMKNCYNFNRNIYRIYYPYNQALLDSFYVRYEVKMKTKKNI